MIIVTNRAPLKSPNSEWSDDPDADGVLHWIPVDNDGNVAGKVESTKDHTLPPEAKRALEADLADRQDLFTFVAGAREFDYEDFTDFQSKFSAAGYDGCVVGFSPAFSTGLDVLPLADSFKKSHAGRRSFSNFLRAIGSFADARLSLMLQSAGNDICARTLNMQEGNLPHFHRILSTGSAVDRSAYAKGAKGKPPAHEDMMVANATRTIDTTDHFTVYHRWNDPLLRLLPAAIWFFQGPKPLGTLPPKDPYKHPDKVSIVNCRRVGPPSHTCYEKEEAILRDIVAALAGKTGDRKLK